MTHQIRIIAVLDDHGDQTLVGNVYDLDCVDRLGAAFTKCGRMFYLGEYEIISEQEAV